MQILLLQTFAWMLLVGLLGAILGCMARRLLGSNEVTADAVAAPARVAAPVAAAAAPVARVVPKAPVVEASKAPAPVAPAAPATAPDRAGSAYSYPVTTVGIPRANPELVQPQIQTINLPAAAAAGAGSVAAAVTIKQTPSAAPSVENTYPITTVGIPSGYVEPVKASPPKAAPAADTTRFERALTGEAGQPRPEPLRPELARSQPAPVPPAAPKAPVAPAPVVAPSVAATVAPKTSVAPPAPEPVKPIVSTPAAPAPVAPAAPTPAANAPYVGKVPNPPIESKPAGIAKDSPPIGPIASKPAGIPAPLVEGKPAAAAPAQPAAPVASKPAAPVAEQPFAPVVAGGAALAAIAARAASAQAAAAAAANAATSAPEPTPAAPVSPAKSAEAPKAEAPKAVAPAAVQPQVATGGDDLMRIRAIDSSMQARLKAAGVTRFAELARWTPNDVSRISQTLGLSGRIEQENWIEQAQILASGGETDYSRRRLRGEIPVGPAASATVAPPAAPKPSSTASDTSSAAATAAAAAMASAAIARATSTVEPAMPSKLVDAIRENLAKPSAAATAAAAPVVAAVTAAADTGRVSRPDLAGLRSVRSEALRDTPPSDQARGGGRGAVDDLKRIRGIGVLIEKKLNSLGVTGYEQIANWTNADIDRISQILDFKGRIERENWVEQSRILASGGQTEFSKRVDRGEA